MATLDGAPFSLVWLHLDMTHAVAPTVVEAAKVKHEGEGDFKLSVNVKEDGTQALVKVVAEQDWVVVSPIILRVFTETDHSEALAMVRDPLWKPELVFP